MNFRVGQKVVCVNNRANNPGVPPHAQWHPACDVPAEGAIYTVRALGLIHGVAGLKLEEITCRGFNAGNYVNDEFYWAERFRPVVERKTDISIFTKMLTDTREPVDAR